MFLPQILLMFRWIINKYFSMKQQVLNLRLVDFLERRVSMSFWTWTAIAIALISGAAAGFSKKKKRKRNILSHLSGLSQQLFYFSFGGLPDNLQSKKREGCVHPLQSLLSHDLFVHLRNGRLEFPCVLRFVIACIFQYIRKILLLHPA